MGTNWYKAPMTYTTTAELIEMNRQSTVLTVPGRNALTAMELTALGDGDRIKAILLVRSRLGLGLADARKYLGV